MRTAARWTLAAFLTLLALIAANAAFAQAVTRDCYTTACTIISDNISGTPASVPTLCRLYSSGAMLEERPVTAPYACSFTRTFAPGTHSLTARYANATQESADSNVIALTVPTPPLPAPANFRFP